MKRTNILAVAAILVMTLAPAALAQSAKTRVWNDGTRLAALLHDAQTSVSVNANVWKTIGNEANTLANRLYANTSGNSTARGLAKDVRMHVREFRTAALAGDAVEARKHASEAMPFLTKLVDWSAPKKT